MKLYDEREEELGDELMRALERFLLLQIIDQRWREHLYDMDYLREGIHLRGFAQIDPLVAYKNEGFGLFQDLMNSIWSDFARMIYNVQVSVEAENGDGALPEQRAAVGGAASALTYTGGTMDDQPSAYGERRPDDASRGRARPSSSSAAWTSTSSSAATTRAGAGRARSTRSATARRTRLGRHAGPVASGRWSARRSARARSARRPAASRSPCAATRSSRCAATPTTCSAAASCAPRASR